MRRRSKLEARRADRPSPYRYLFYISFVLLSLAIPAALIFRGERPSPSQKTEGGALSDQRPADSASVSPLVWKGIGEGIPSKPQSADDIHVVFSTDCSPYQNYQSIMLFNSAEIVEQKGPVTRVASGCTQQEMEELQSLVDKQPERFRVHFTPDYSVDAETGEQFMFYNKPNGMAHFLRNADPPVAEAVVALIDPDMILMSRLTPYVGNPSVMLWHDDEESADKPDWVEEGKPVGQFYGLGGHWTKWQDLPTITESLGPDTPARQISQQEASAGYPVGPPYLMHPRDWARLLDLWVSLAAKVYKKHPGILAEMYGFCIAAAHLRLRHRVAYGLMVSDSSMADREGWPLVDALGARACDASAVSNLGALLPPVIHYCQLYRVGTYMFGKRHKSHHSFFSCTADALELPPPDYLLSPMGTLRVHPRPFQSGKKKNTVQTEETVPVVTGVRQGYIMCGVLRAMNAAQASYKNRYCQAGEISGGVRRFTDLTPAQLATDRFA